MVALLLIMYFVLRFHILACKNQNGFFREYVFFVGVHLSCGCVCVKQCVRARLYVRIKM